MLENRAGNCTVTHNRGMKMKATELDTKEVTVTRTEKRYVLNEKVFDLDNCPDWAQYAAVDHDGIATWFSSKAFLTADNRWQAIKLFPGKCKVIDCTDGRYIDFDTEDYEISLIKRPEKLLDVTMADLEKKYGGKIKIVRDVCDLILHYTKGM